MKISSKIGVFTYLQGQIFLIHNTNATTQFVHSNPLGRHLRILLQLSSFIEGPVLRPFNFYIQLIVKRTAMYLSEKKRAEIQK